MATKKRLADVDVLIAGYKACVEHDPHEYIPPAMIVEDLESQPLVDAVEVVRCKNCKNRPCNRVCKIFKRQMDDDCYCSYGEREIDG